MYLLTGGARIPVERNLQPLESSRALVMPGPDLGMCSDTREGCVSYIVPYHALQLCKLLGADTYVERGT